VVVTAPKAAARQVKSAPAALNSKLQRRGRIRTKTGRKRVTGWIN
jgi:hypothetical protein